MPAVGRPAPVPHVRRARSLLEAHVAFTMPFGMFSPPIAYAMVMQRHMYRFGTTVEQMGHVAVTDPGPCGAQPPRRDGGPAHDDGRLPGVATGLGAASGSSTAASRTTGPVPWW